ncbi:MAG: O-antigen ligase family protein [Burkholderiaceae bacterium]
MKLWAALGEPLAWGLAAVAGALVVAKAATLGESAAAGVGVVGLLGIGAWLAWRRRPKEMLVAGLYFLAPVDVSKALVAPIDRFYSPGLYLTVAEVVLLLLALLWAGRRLFIERRGLPFTRLDGLALAYFGWLCLRTAGSLQGTLAAASAVSYGLAVLAYYVASHALESPAEIRLALRAAAAGLAAETLWVAAQMATHTPLALPGAKVMPSAGDMLFFGGAGEAFRPTGFFIHPNSLADHMTLLIPPAFALVLLGLRRLDARVWWTALAVLAAATGLLLVTLSRGGWAAAALGGAWVVWRYARGGLLTRRQLAAMALAGLAGVVVLLAAYPEILLRLTAPDERSTESRLILTDQALTIIKAHPWIGVGFGGYNRAAYEYIAPAFANISEEYQQALLELVVHDHYLLIAAELGVPAALFFLALMLRFAGQPGPWGAWRDPTAFALAVGLSGAVVTQVLFLASDNFYADIRVFMIWLVAGTLQALCLQQRAGLYEAAAGGPPIPGDVPAAAGRPAA